MRQSPRGAPYPHFAKAIPLNTTPVVDSAFSSTTPGPGERALVLHGGGSAGNAWEIGVIAGLCHAGLDVTEADLIVGTSAGSTAAAQITSSSPADLLESILRTAAQPRTAPLGSNGSGVAEVPVANHMELTNVIIAAAEDAADMRRRMGVAALELDKACDGAGQRQWRATVAARLPSQHWPQRPLLIVAVDAESGEPVVFDRHSGVELVDAVAASCANGFGVAPYSIGDNRYIDGGTGATRMPIWRPDTDGCWCCHHSVAGPGTRCSGACSLERRSKNYAPAGAGSKPCSLITRPRRIRYEHDGSVYVSRRRASRLQPRQSPGRAAHPVLELTSARCGRRASKRLPGQVREIRPACGPRRSRACPTGCARPDRPGSGLWEFVGGDALGRDGHDVLSLTGAGP